MKEPMRQTALIVEGNLAIGDLLRAHLDVLSMVAGLAILVMGLNFLGVFRIQLLHRTARPHVNEPAGLWGAFVMGLAFGWLFLTVLKRRVMPLVVTHSLLDIVSFLGAGLLPTLMSWIGR